MRLIRTQSDGIMAGVSRADGGGYDWETWFEQVSHALDSIFVKFHYIVLHYITIKITSEI